MNITVVDMSGIAPPPADGAIESALSDASEKVSAWVRAVRDIQVVLSDTPQPAGSSHEASAVADRARPGGSDLSGTPTEPSTSPESSAPAHERSAEPEPVAPETATAAPEPETAAEAPHDAPSQSKRKPKAKPSRPVIGSFGALQPDPTLKPTASAPSRPADQPPEEQVDTTEPEPRDEDETLLASLDEETAKAIRVMRRLSPVHKTVRELLEQYETSKAAPAMKTGRKKSSWFSRG